MTLLLVACVLTGSCQRSAHLAPPPARPVDLSAGWVDLTEGMVLLLETAYFRDGAKTRNIADYIGTEKMALRTGRDGALAMTEHVKLPARPAKQPSVVTLFPARERRRHRQRLYFQVVVNKASGKANAVVLSAGGQKEMAALVDHLIGKSVCASGCTVVPEGSSVSLAMEVIVNGQPRTVLWGTNARGVAGADRVYTHRRGDKTLPPGGFPLLPGDRLDW